MAFIKKFSLLLLYILISSDLDLWTSSLFYQDGSFQNHALLSAIYILGPVPGWVVVIGALIGCFIPKYHHLKRTFIYLILVLALGSGLIVHAALKETWGRPRPKQVVQFGGHDAFRPFYVPNFNESGDVKHRSFASGHVTMGYFFFSIYFIGRSLKNRNLKNLGLFLSFFLGILLTYARVAQGGHFLSDALASMLVMWLTASLLTPILDHERSYAKAS